MRLQRSSLLLSFASLLLSTGASAFWNGTVEKDGVELKADANDSSRTVRTLPAGTPFNSSDEQARGYYKLNTSYGAGWVRASDLPPKGRKPRKKAAAPVF